MNPADLEAAVDAVLTANPEFGRKYSRQTIRAHISRLIWRLTVIAAMDIDGDLSH